jgi:hypothetical protein
MIDLFLRFDDVDMMLTALRPHAMTYTDDDDQEHVSAGGHDYALYVLGEIPGRSGHHVNLRIISTTFDHSFLEPYSVNPAQPYCRWA